jgi:long-chain acyl-CoA synthetase
LTFWEVIDFGKQDVEVGFDEPTPDTFYMFCYTSGTTGDPKGAMLTQGQLLATMNVSEFFRFFESDRDSSLSFLPYGHVMEQGIFIKSFIYGFKTGYYSGDVLKLMDDMQVLKPTFIAIVPRVLNRVY